MPGGSTRKGYAASVRRQAANGCAVNSAGVLPSGTCCPQQIDGNPILCFTNCKIYGNMNGLWYRDGVFNMTWKRAWLLFIPLLVLAWLFSSRDRIMSSGEFAEDNASATTPEADCAEPVTSSLEEGALDAYAAFLSGNWASLGDAQPETWWIPGFPNNADSFKYVKYEYTYLDLDGDVSPELLVQIENDPGGYNGVFHFDGDRLQCWNSDAVEMTCRDYPLIDGTVVRQYDYGGTRSYTLFRYHPDGEREEIHSLFARDELVYENSELPCPYYSIDGTEVDKAEFEEELRTLVTAKILDRSCWISIGELEE